MTAEVDMGTVKTGNADRDAHLTSSDFFDAETKPTMSVTSTAIIGQGEEFTLAGDITVNGVTRPIELDVEFFAP